MTRSVARALGSALFGASALVGCNTILDNEPGKLVTESSDASATLPTLRDADSATTTTPPTDPPPSSTCTAGLHACSGQCVGTGDPAYGCAATSCAPCLLTHATATCAAGACATDTCDRGWADCNAAPADGCETDLSKPATCGACNTPCPSSAPNCQASGAGFVCTNGCSAATPLLCAGACVDPLTNATHCGGCAVKCPDVANGTTTCAAGVCGFTCKVGFHACGASCAADTDPAACGAACVVCPAAAHAQVSCVVGVCGKTCDPNFGDCDANPANGCEASLMTDDLHCGTCAVACLAPLQTCKGGVCK